MKGEATNPHQPEQLKAKFFDLGTSVWDEAQTRKLFEGLMVVEAIQDFRAFAKDFAL